MHKGTYTSSPLMMDIGMTIAIFIIALVTMLGTILRLIASCINIIARLVYVISDCGAELYVNITRRRPEAIACSTN